MPMFCAVKVIGKVPVVPEPGVPESTPLVALKFTPEGRAPDSLSDGVGEPVAVTVNEPEVPTVNVVLFALLMAGGRNWPDDGFGELSEKRASKRAHPASRVSRDGRYAIQGSVWRSPATSPVSKCKFSPLPYGLRVSPAQR